MTKETCLTWLKQKLAARETIAANWLKHSVEFNRATQAEVKLLKELITEVECS
jgi:hypothetical protein